MEITLFQLKSKKHGEFEGIFGLKYSRVLRQCNNLQIVERFSCQSGEKVDQGYVKRGVHLK